MAAGCDMSAGVSAVQEFQKDNRNLVISETEMKQTVYIYKCERSTIQIKGKVNAITLGKSVSVNAVPFRSRAKSMQSPSVSL